MATQVTLRSKQQILGNMLRRIVVDTDLSAVTRGTNIAIFLEAISEAIAQAEASALKILETIDLESLVGTALDKKAISIRLPNGQGGFGRKPAVQSSGSVTIGSAFSKVSSKLYAGKPAPFAGSTVLNVEDASLFTATGSVYIGRGTVDRFEGPIPYSSVVNNGSFFTITLDNAMTKSHLQSDLVTLSQGGDRGVTAGTIVQVPSNSDSPAVNYNTTRDLLLPDGEAEGSVSVVSTQFGEVGNAAQNAINAFTTVPFVGATVRNPVSLLNGQSTESDENLRQRIRDFPATLSRGTNSAIQAAIQGATDPDSGRSIQNSTIVNPVEAGDFARVFIDDGVGLEPEFDNQPTEELITSAQGQETRFRVAKRPITAPLIQGSETSPFVLIPGMTLTVRVDDVTEIYTITVSNYKSIGAATAFEIARDFNEQSNIVGFRTLDDGARLSMLDLSGKAEIIQVTSGALQQVLGFPTAEIRSIFLYQNANLLSFRGSTATLITRARNLWSISEPELQNIPIIVDSVTQTFSVLDSDFDEFNSNITDASVIQWATVLSRKIAGVKFSTSGQFLVLSTWQDLSATGSIEIPTTKIDGSSSGWVGDDKIWATVESGGALLDVGAVKNFDLNRFTGEITLINKMEENDSLRIATRQTRAFINSTITDTGLFSLDPLPGTTGNSKVIVGFDGNFSIRAKTIPDGSTITATQPDSSGATNIIRLTLNDVGLFSDAFVDDIFYILTDVSQAPALPTVEGFYKIKLVGANTTAVDLAVNNVDGTAAVILGVTFNVRTDSDIVSVSKLSHGYKTGDLITTTVTIGAGDIGGITGPQLSVTDLPIIVTSLDEFTYVAAATATSDAAGVINTLGTNVVTISQTSHGYETGSFFDVTSAVPIGGISAIDLTVTDTPITVIDDDSWEYRADAASISTATANIATVTQKADVFVEFEVSTPQLAVWSTILSTPHPINEDMIYIFKSEGVIPQIIDFGSSASLTVDQTVALMAEQIASGSITKLSPRQVQVRSNYFNLADSSCAVLGVIGNAENLFTAATSLGQQAHVAFSGSKSTNGSFPVIDSIVPQTAVTAGYATRTYLSVDRNITNVTTEGVNPVIDSPLAFNAVYPDGFQHLWLTGRASGYSARVYNNQTTAPYTGILSSSEIVQPLNTFDDLQTFPDTLDRYAHLGLRLQDVPFNNFDSVTVEMDLNPTDKTVASPMSKLAAIQDIDTIAGSGKGQVISFRLKDPEDGNLAFFDSSSVYVDFDFSNFKMLTKSVGLYRTDVSDRALILRSTDVGGTNRLRLSIRYSTAASQADITVTHTTNYLSDETRLNLIAILASDTEITTAPLLSGTYKVTATASGTIYDWRISGGTLNINNDYVVDDILNISGTSNLSGSYKILSTISTSGSSVTANVTSASTTVNVTLPAHGLATGDLVNVTTSVAIGGISAIDLTQTGATITVTGPGNFEYEAGAAATSTTSGTIDTVTGGVVVVKSPGSGGLAPSSTFNAAQAPIRTWPLVDKTLEDLADAINAYFVTNPVSTGVAIGTSFGANPIKDATYITYPAASAYSGSDMSGAFGLHSFSAHLSGSAGIFQYDSSVPSINGIKATVQTDESIFPTSTEASGTSYSPIDEEVYIVPTNSRTISDWLAFRAVSSLNILSNIERIGNDDGVQFSSKLDGGDGAVRVTGVSANTLSGSVIGNSTNDDTAIKTRVLNAFARSLAIGEVVSVQNSVADDIRRSYRFLPTGTSETVSNTTNINDYFRDTNSVKYIRISPNVGRLIFLRNGQGSGQSEPLAVDNEITFTDLGSGLVRVTSAQGANVDPLTGKLAARTGDMMYIQPTATMFSVDARCKPLPTSGVTDAALPEYLGYPVVNVEDDNNIVIIAPNITAFGGPFVLVNGQELTFLPAVYNEKNIRTNHAEGAKFDTLLGNGEAYYLVKSLGNGFVSVWLQNSSTEATDSMELSKMSVSTDDYVVFGSQFNPANQGTYRLIAHNGTNHMIVFNGSNGVDELVDTFLVSQGGKGDRKWRVGPLNLGAERPIRIVSADSARIGDLLRISTPSDSAQWFNDTFIGSHTITGIGMSAIDYSGDPPHVIGGGAADPLFIAPFVDFTFTNAPIAITDSVGSPVDSFLIGNNQSSLGFVEGTPFSTFRTVLGHGHDPQNAENRDLYLAPQLSASKMSDTFGTTLASQNKLGFAERTFQGIDGYQAYDGLVQLAHRIIDGQPENILSFSGVKAAGAGVEVLTALIKTIQVEVQVRPKDGVSLNSITDQIKSSIANYVNTLGPGNPVVLSEIIATVQKLAGVFSVEIISTTPPANDGRIVVADIERPKIQDTEEDVSVG